ncbi:MAG: thioredoxin family protein [Chitinophagales bacterium]
MKNLLFLLITTLLFASCKTMHEAKAQPQASTQQSMNQEVKPVFGSSYLIGKVNREGFMKENYNDWFQASYNEYEVDETTLAVLQGKLENVEVKVFMGTWCPDSQREVPHFYKILDDLQFDENQLTVISMDKYKETPEEYETGLDIQRVPTIIFYKGDQEMGRIVESPNISLEKDMTEIVK